MAGEPEHFKRARALRPKKPPKLKPLTERQKALIHWYFHPSIHKVKRKALEAAGYSTSTATANPMAIFNHPSVAAAIAEQEEELNQRFHIDAEWLSRKAKILVEANMGEILEKLNANEGDVSCLSAEEKYQLSELTQETFTMGRGKDAVPVKKLKLKAESRLKGIDTLAKLHGLNKEVATVNVGLTVVEILQRGRSRVKKLTEPGIT